MARSFNGTNDYIQLDTNYQPSTSTSNSFAAWINLSNVNPGHAQAIFGGSNNGFEFRWDGASSTTGTLSFLETFVTGIGNSSTITTSANTWHHAAVTYDGTNLNFYWDGVNVGSSSNTVTVGAERLFIGAIRDGLTDNFNGSLADAAAWTVILTAGEVAALAKGARPGTIRTDRVWLPLDGLQSPEPDLSGNKTNGTLTGTALAPGPPVMQFTPRWPNALFAPTLQPFGSGISGSRSFNGSSDVISLGVASALNATAITVSVWVKPSSLANAYSGLFSRNQNADTSGVYNLYLKSSGQLAVYLLASSPISYDPGSHTLSIGTWYHVAFSYDSVNGLIGYVNGASDGTAAANGVLNPTIPPYTARIGNDAQVASRFFGGSAADTAVWSVALSAGEILALANGARPNTVRSGSLVGYWPLNALSGPYPEPDYSGNANNGILTGTTPAAGPPVMQFSPRWPQFQLPPLPVFTLMPQIVT